MNIGISKTLKEEIINKIFKKYGKKRYYSLNLTNSYTKKLTEITELERKELNAMNPGISIILRE